MKKEFVLVILIFLTLYGCGKREFIADTVDPRMPSYTESGTNTAGAYIDGKVWIASPYFYPNNTINEDQNMFFQYSGESDSLYLAFQSGQMLSDGKNVSIGFYIPGFLIRNTNDLYQLKGETFLLDGTNSYGELLLDDHRIERGPNGDHRGMGALHFRHIESSPDSGRVVVSGTFGFDVEVDGNHHTVYSGRFDYNTGYEEIRQIRR